MRFGIAARLALLLAIVGMLAAGLSGFYAQNVSRNLLEQSSKNELLTSTQVIADRIAVSREEVTRNLRMLTAHPDTITTLEHDLDTQGHTSEDHVASLFDLMIRTHPSYFQIRLISAQDHGLERVRVDRTQDGPLRVSGDDLQEKGHYAYVFDTLKLGAGQTYLSRFAINHELGSHLGLGRPTAQLAMPVIDADGRALGLIVINIDLHAVFSVLTSGIPKQFKLFLTNSEGDFLIHPDPTQTFGFDRGRRILLQDEFPATRALVRGDVSEVMVKADSGNYANAPLVAAFISKRITTNPDENDLILGLAEPLASVLQQADALGVVILQIVIALCAACVLVAIIVARAVTRPINSMSIAVKNFAAGEPMKGLPLTRKDEIGELAHSFNRLGMQISSQLAELEYSRQELEHLAQHDPLTGLPNRALFADRMKQALAAIRREHGRFALMFVDLDNFKPINDEHGHAIGDLLLKECAARLSHVIRESDTAARIGGDEFTLLLRNIHNHEDARAVAEKIRNAIRTPFMIEGRALSVSASIGVALCPDAGIDEIDLSKHSDQAMYRAKQSGRDTIVFHQPKEAS